MNTPGTAGPSSGRIFLAHGPLGFPVATTTWTGTRNTVGSATDTVGVQHRRVGLRPCELRCVSSSLAVRSAHLDIALDCEWRYCSVIRNLSCSKFLTPIALFPRSAYAMFDLSLEIVSPPQVPVEILGFGYPA